MRCEEVSIPYFSASRLGHYLKARSCHTYHVRWSLSLSTLSQIIDSSSCIITKDQVASFPFPLPLPLVPFPRHSSMHRATLSTDDHDVHPLFKDSEIPLEELAARGLLLPKDGAAELS